MAGDLQGCIRVIEEVLASTPGFGFGHNVLVWAYDGLGEKDKAIAAQANHFRLTMNFPEGALALETAYAKGDYSHAMLQAAEALEERSNPRFIKLLRDIKLDYWADKYSQPGD